MIDYQTIVALLVIFAVTVLPVSLAARFADAKRPGFIASAIAIVLSVIVENLVLVEVHTTILAGLALAFLSMCVVYALVLRVSLVGALGVAVMAFFLQVVIVVGLVSFGMHLQGISH
jgi:hypothetical protein